MKQTAGNKNSQNLMLTSPGSEPLTFHVAATITQKPCLTAET